MPPDEKSRALSIPVERLSAFVRQFTHDVRNGLNAVELEAALIAEIADDPELIGEVKKLRGMVAHVTEHLQKTSSYFRPMTLNAIVYKMAEVLAGSRDRIAEVYPEEIKTVQWSSSVNGQRIRADFELLSAALIEIFKNAFQFREGGKAIEFSAIANDAGVSLELAEEKSAAPSSIENWGLQPLLTTRRGAYGLGHFHARQIVELHGGTIDFEFDAARSRLITRIFLPLENE